jgi:hypothetical protein
MLSWCLRVVAGSWMVRRLNCSSGFAGKTVSGLLLASSVVYAPPSVGIALCAIALLRVFRKSCCSCLDRFYFEPKTL